MTRAVGVTHEAEWSAAAPKLMQKVMHSAAAEAHQMGHLRADMMVSREAFCRRGREFAAFTAASCAPLHRRRTDPAPRHLAN